MTTNVRMLVLIAATTLLVGGCASEVTLSRKQELFSMKVFDAAKEGGSVAEQYREGLASLRGATSDAEYREALETLSHLQNQASASLESCNAGMILAADGLMENKGRASRLEPFKDCNPTAANFSLAFMHYYGYGTRINLAEFERAMDRAGTLGSVEANEWLGEYYYYGEGSQQPDRAQAEVYMTRAIGLGSALALAGLAQLRVDGKRHVEAFELSARACEKGLVESCVFVGLRKFDGVGTRQDIEKGTSVLARYANESSRASTKLGLHYLLNPKSPDDFAMASKLFENSIKISGDPSAYYYLGYMYMDGMGVEKDPTRARSLFQKASAGGVKEAKEAMDWMEQEERSSQH